MVAYLSSQTIGDPPIRYCSCCGGPIYPFQSTVDSGWDWVKPDPITLDSYLGYHRGGCDYLSHRVNDKAFEPLRKGLPSNHPGYKATPRSPKRGFRKR